MKIVKPAANVFAVDSVSPYRFIELVGRTCYKSEDKITDDSAVNFVKSMYKSNHHAMLEHYHVIIQMDKRTFSLFFKLLSDTGNKDHVNLMSFINITNRPVTPNHSLIYVSGSFAAFIRLMKFIGGYPLGHELGRMLHSEYPELFPDYVFDPYEADGGYYMMTLIRWTQFKQDIEDEEWLTDEEKCKILSHHTVISCKFVCDRGVSHEFVRHRPASFAQESTRYCNYSNEKFGKEITVIDSGFEGSELDCWKEAMETSERMYFALLDKGAKPQMARGVLPTDLKTELWITATEEEWQHIINLRYHGTTGAPHPKMLDVMKLVYSDLCTVSEHRLK